MDVSFDDLLSSYIDSRDDAVIICKCKSSCLSRTRCACRGADQTCKQTCKCGSTSYPCKNDKQVDDSEEDSDLDDDEEETKSSNQSDEDQWEDVPMSLDVPSASVKSKNTSTKTSAAKKATKKSTTKKTSLKSKAGKTTSKKPKPNQLPDEVPMQLPAASDAQHIERIRKQETEIQNFLHGLGRCRLEEICAELLRRQPGAYNDFILQERESQEHPGTGDPSPGDQPPSPEAAGRGEQLNWCKAECSCCREMPLQIERKCCKPKRGQRCITTTAPFARLCLDPMVLEIAMRVNEDIFVEEIARGNASYRHQAYRTYIYWQHGRLGAGNRRVVPSCAVWAIRDRWPEVNGIYTGFIEGVGHLQD